MKEYNKEISRTWWKDLNVYDVFTEVCVDNILDWHNTFNTKPKVKSLKVGVSVYPYLSRKDNYFSYCGVRFDVSPEIIDWKMGAYNYSLVLEHDNG